MASDDRLYFLIATTAHRLRVMADRRCLDNAGITAAQAGAMWAIKERKGATQRDVAGALRLGESAVTPMVGRLVDAGLVKRTRSTTDARAWTVALTARGRKALDAIEAELYQFNADVLASLDRQQRAALVDGLRAVLANTDSAER